MSDTGPNPDVNIRTNADLARAKELEAQLELAIANARLDGRPHHLYETHLKSVRAAIDQHQTNAQAAGVTVPAKDPGTIPTTPNNPPPPSTNSISLTPPSPALDNGQVPQSVAATSQSNNDFARNAGNDTQSLQASGERLRAALQQNTLITTSLFNQTLELINAQNQKLSEVGRKISELSNQIKSLKNP